MMKATRFFVEIIMVFFWIFIYAQVEAQQSSSGKSDSLSFIQKTLSPPYQFQPWKTLYCYDHPMFGAAMCALGDVNGDGYNDFAVSTLTDTTFIFFGGPNFDEQPKAFVLGGGLTICSGDFNGDGYPDIATAEYDLDLKLDPMFKGKVRIYLHNKTPTMYNTEPELILNGINPGTELGTRMMTGDFNGDAKTDLVIPAIGEKTQAYEGKVYIYLGKVQLDTIADFVMEDRKRNHENWFRGRYGYTIAVGDFNGDQYDDLVIKGWEQTVPIKSFEFNYEIYYGGNPPQFTTPTYDLDSRQYPFCDWWVDAADANGDGKSDLFFDRYYHPPLDLAIIWGRSTQLPIVLPDTVFPIPEPLVMSQGQEVDQMGDLNADGKPDYFISWIVPSVGGNSQYLYKGGSPWDKKAIAYYGVRPEADEWIATPIPLKDIDGDGIDDFGIVRDVISYWKSYGSQGIRIYRGDKRITPVEIMKPPESFKISIYPNPVAKEAMITYTLTETSNVNIVIYDSNGKTVRTSDEGIQEVGIHTKALLVDELPSGSYILTLNAKGTKTEKIITIVK